MHPFDQKTLVTHLVTLYPCHILDHIFYGLTDI